jgi:hypothetical protein
MVSIGCVRSSAWHWLFSSTQITSALSGGLRYRPATSRSFSMKIGSLESLKLSVRLQAKELEVAHHAALGDAGLNGHTAHAPMRRAAGWLGVRRGLDQFRHALIVECAGISRARIVVQVSDAPLNETRAPLAHHGGLGERQSLGDGVVELAVGTAQDDACPRSTTIGPSVCQLSSQCLRSQDTASTCTMNASYQRDKTLAHGLLGHVFCAMLGTNATQTASG